jgi:acetylornithine/succinyldiaminopimelate/putrescine aminotransferase
MAFIRANGAEMERTGRYYHENLGRLAARFSDLCDGIAGDGLMSALSFRKMEQADAFCKYLNNTLCVDASAQTYKIGCPPVVLTKLPLIVSETMVDQLLQRMEQALLYAGNREVS